MELLQSELIFKANSVICCALSVLAICSSPVLLDLAHRRDVVRFRAAILLHLNLKASHPILSVIQAVGFLILVEDAQ